MSVFLDMVGEYRLGEPDFGARTRICSALRGFRPSAVSLDALSAMLIAAAPYAAVQAQTTIYEETFTQASSLPVEKITAYTSATGETYTADAPWLINCNGWVAQWNQPADAANAAAQIADCGGGAGGNQSWNVAQQLSQSLGILDGQTPAQARDNFAVSAMTSGNPGPNRIEVESSQISLDVPSGGVGRFVTFRVYVAAVNCPPVASAPLLRFFLVSPDGVETGAGGTVDACGSTQVVQAEPRGVAGATNVRVGRYLAPGAILYDDGTTLGVRVRNAQGSGAGNDHAFDNLTILDVTPSLTKAFATPVLAGQPSRLTFTVTNTPELLQKQGWSFTDTLMTGLQIANPANVATTCTGTNIAAPAGGTIITITNGNLPANAASCTIAVDVMAPDPGNYQNGANNMSPSVALNLPPSDSAMEVVTNRLTLSKISREGAGAFAITGNNGIVAQTLTTTTPGTPVDGTAQVLDGTSGTTDTTITETLPADWLLRDADCTGLAAGVTATFTQAGVVTIPAAGLAPQTGGRDVTCTLENLLGGDLTIAKQNADPTGGRVERGATTRYTLTVGNNGPGTSTNPIVRDTPGPGLTCAAANPVTCTGPAGACPAGAATVADLTGAAGLALGTLAVGASVSLQFDCVVQ